MSAITVSRTLPFPVETVWEKLADFGGIHRFSAGVEHSPINAGTPATGVGAERNCKLYDGNNLQERITEFVVNERLAVEIFETSMPLAKAGGRFELKALPDGGTHLSMTMEYSVKYGPLGWMMDAMMMRRMMTNNLGNLLAALGHHMTTGENIEKGWKRSA